MLEEMDVIQKNQTWELVDGPKDKEIIGVKWICKVKFNFFFIGKGKFNVFFIGKVKFNVDGFILRNKARLVAKGYTQQPSVDFHETFALVSRLECLLHLLPKGWLLHQLDVKSVF